MNPEILSALLIFAALALAALLVYWLDRKRWRLWRIIQSEDPLQVEAARSWITPRLAPFLIQKYWQATDWSKKRAIVELLQDQTHPDLPKLMLDFLRVPLETGDEQTELAQAIALGFVDERYDRFMEYYNDRDLLAWDVCAALGSRGLRAEPPPSRPPVQPARPPAAIPDSTPPDQRLLLGINANNLPAVQQTLQQEADINTMVAEGNYRGCSALILAMLLGRYEIARFLIEQGADIHFARADLQGNFHPGRGQTALWWAANHGYLPLAEELIRRGVNINAPDHFDGTPLSTAASGGQLEMVRYLVEHGADIHARLSTNYNGIPDGRKAFHLAVTNGHLPVVEYLLQAGNDPNEPGGSGFTPLMGAVADNFYDLAGLLIQRGADVNAVHSGPGGYIGLRGYTPLVFAVNAGLVRMTKMLIQAGADIHYRVPAGMNWDGKALPERGLLDFAKGKRGESLIKLLRARGLH